jgi:predicted O-methyltransferase YrrM
MPAVFPDIAIVAHNTDYYLLNLLASIERLRAVSEIDRVYVWDNASSDSTDRLLDVYGQTRPWLGVHRSHVNVHHGPALDALLKSCCRSEWVVVLDADTEIVTPFGDALGRLDLREAVFAGQMHPQMPHLYAYLAHLLVHRERYADLPPFKHHGAPGIDYFSAIEREGRPYARFRWCDYVHHFGQGALRRVVELGQRDNAFYRFARDEHARHPKPDERVQRERELAETLQTFLSDAASMPRTSARARTPVAIPASTQAAPNRAGRLRRIVDEAALWMRAPRLARRLHTAKQMGLVQRDGEIAALVRIVDRLRPVRVLEIGTAHGGSFLLWARAAAADATLVSIYLPPWEADDPAGADKQRTLERIGSARQSVHLIRGNSHDERVRAQARECLGGYPLDYLFIDGDRSYEGVMKDFEDYAGWVRPGGIVALHDIHPHSKGWGGEVPTFWRHIRRRHRHTELVSDPQQDGFGIGVIWA